MFCPVGYYNFSEILELTDDWALRILLSKQMENAGGNPLDAFEIEHVSEYMFSRVAGFEKIMDPPSVQELGFTSHILGACILSKLVMEYSPSLCSAEGRLMRIPEAMLLHADRLDWCHWRWPIRSCSEFHGFFQSYDKWTENMSLPRVNLYERFCFLDPVTGLVSIKNNSAATFSSASHSFYYDLNESKKYIANVVTPFEGWAWVWKKTDFPEKLFDVFTALGIDEPSWGLLDDKVQIKEPRKRGRPNSGAEKAFYELRPNGKESEDTWESLVAEMLEVKGIRISARSLQMYNGKHEKKP